MLGKVSSILDFLMSESMLFGLAFVAVVIISLHEILSPQHSNEKKVIFGMISLVCGVMSVVSFV